jgi:signal transduction histidine kinase
MSDEPSLPPGRLLLFFLGVSLRLKIMGMVVGLTLLFGTITSLMVRHALYANMEEFICQESQAVANEFAYQAPEFILINDIYGLNQLITVGVSNRQNLRYVVIVDNDGHVLTHTFGSGFPKELIGHIHSLTQAQTGNWAIMTNEGLVWEATAPLLQGQQGFVLVGVSEKKLVQDIEKFISALIGTTVLVGLTGIIVAAILTMLIMRPIKGLLVATKAVHGGDYNPPLPVASRDEVGALTKAFAGMTSELQKVDIVRQEKDAMSRNFLQSVMASQESERKRIARELHDQTGQSLASLQVELRLLEKNKQSTEAQGNIDRLRQTITKELDAIHHMAVELRPSVLDDMGLVAALEMYCSDFRQRYAIDVDLSVVGFHDQRPAPCIETCFYRIAQELLNNGLRHGKADSLSVLLRWQDKTIRLIVEDNGVGFNPAILRDTTRLGIHGVRERVKLVGGQFRLESEPGQGTIIIITVPVDPGECHD